MGTPRSNRRQSKICYKEDSFEEFDYTPTKSQSRASTIKHKAVMNAANKNLSQQISAIPDDYESVEKDTKVSTTNWNPTIVLTNVSYKSESDSEQGVSNGNRSLRRGTRMRYKTTLAVSSENSRKLTKYFCPSSSDTDDSIKHQIIEKPTCLFTEDDVEGKELFGFKTTHRKTDMVRKAVETAMDSPKVQNQFKDVGKSCSTPKTPKSAAKHRSLASTPGKRGRNAKLITNTPPKSEQKQSGVEKTPHRLRKQMQKRLETMIRDDDSNSPFSDSGTDYCPSDGSVSTDEKNESEMEEGSNSDSSTSAIIRRVPEPEKNAPRPYALRRARGDRDNNYIMKSDDYFSMHGSKKVVTSNHTLERLKTPRLTEDKLHTILKSHQISKEHQSSIKELMEDHARLYDKWIYLLSEGFSILLHGVGTKQKLIEDFQSKKLSKYPCIVVNGFFPSLTVKDILESIMIDLLELRSVPSNVYEAVKLIRDEMENVPNQNVFLLIHNIDGAMLKNNKTQSILSQLAKIKNIHLVASVDHINAPLICDHAKLSNYNFSWWDVTTMLPYQQETSFESSLLVHKSSALALSSLKNVFQSLTTNARGIFMIIVNNQLKNKKQPHYQGIAFKDLYWSARESFLVSSDLALRAQLTEFLDHKLVKNRRTAEGIENLIIPIDNVLLQQFIDQNE